MSSKFSYPHSHQHHSQTFSTAEKEKENARIANSKAAQANTTMQLPAGVNRRYATVAAFLLIAIWCWVAFDRPYSFPTHIPWNIYSNSPQASPAIDAFDFGAVDSGAIRSVCADTAWNASVVFSCEGIGGGVAEVRNEILGCVRYVIAAGGSLVLPRIELSEDWGDVRRGNTTEMDYMFDVDHFVDSLGLSCPQLRIYDTVDDVEDRGNGHGPFSLVPETLVKYVPKEGLEHPDDWREFFYTWLERYILPDVQGPIFVNLGRSYLQYSVNADGQEFALSFGNILKFRLDIRILATMTLLKLSQAYSMSITVTKPIIKNVFLGVHLWSGPLSGLSAADRAFGQYDKQAKLYLQQASQSNLTIIYVASTNGSEITRFSQDGLGLGISVTTKFDLLKGNSRQELQALNLSEQSMVDFLVMLKASEFVGVGHSSLAWNVALKRHLLSREKEYLDGPQMLNDEFSQIYGTPRAHPEYAACMWP